MSSFFGGLRFGAVGTRAALLRRGRQDAALDMPALTPVSYTHLDVYKRQLLYYVPMEGLFGFTVGKLVTGTRVVNAQGGRPTWGQAFGRTLCRLIPFEPFSLFFSKDGEVRGWHDSVPKTWVVRRRR